MPDLQLNSQSRSRRWIAMFILTLLPPIVTGGVYFPSWSGEPLISFSSHVDASFCVYELERAKEVGFRYWQLADDPLVGKPYPTGAAKHPGLYEGLDFLLIGATVGHWLSPEATFRFAMGLLVTINGWIVAALVFRSTRSIFWSAIAATLMVCNMPIALRAPVHANLLKVGYCLLAISAYFELVNRPSLWRGIRLGLTMALTLAGSYYLAYLLGIGLVAMFAVDVLFRRIEMKHLLPMSAAAAVFVGLAAAIAFPVFLQSRMPLAQVYFERNLLGVWQYGAELWQYLRAYPSSTPNFNWGGMLFPGNAVLAALLILGIGRLRGSKFDPIIGRLSLLLGLLVVLSLRGGPGVWLFQYVRAFRCYDRAGLIAVGIAIVMTGLIGARLCILFPGRKASLICWMALLLTAIDVAVLPTNVARVERRRERLEGIAGETVRKTPGWAIWLKDQPAHVKLAAFGDLHRGDLLADYWHWESLYLRSAVHHHATLNGCEIKLLDADLHLLGASFASMTPDGLRFVASLGYDSLAFDAGYLAAHPWISTSPWLTQTAVQDGWTIFRVRELFQSWPSQSSESLAKRFERSQHMTVPAEAWMTERVEFERDLVRTDNSQLSAGWFNEAGAVVGKLEPVLAQRYFSNLVPMLRAKTPKKPGQYSLALLDENGNRLAARQYLVDDKLERVVATAPDRIVDVQVDAKESLGEARLVLRNRGPQFVAAKLGPKRSRFAFEWHPGLGDHLPTTTIYAATWTAKSGAPAARRVCPLPCDLPPQSKTMLPLGLTDEMQNHESGRLVVGFEFVGPAEHAIYSQHTQVAAKVGQRIVLAEKPQVVQGDHFENVELGAIASGGIHPPGSGAIEQHQKTDSNSPHHILAGDFTGDRKADIASFDSTTGVWQVLVTDSKPAVARHWATWNPSAAWSNFVTADFTGDGKADIAAMDSATGVWYVAVSEGGRFDTIEWSTKGQVSIANLQAIDLNGDGRTDLRALSVETGKELIWLSRGDHFEGPLNDQQLAALKRNAVR